MKKERRSNLYLLAIIGLALLMAIPVSTAMAARPSANETGSVHETPITVTMNGYTVDANTFAGLPSDLIIDHYQYGRGHYILTFDKPVTNEMKTAVTEAGGKILSYAGNNQFIVEISDSDLTNVKAQPDVKSVVIDQPAFRISRSLDNIDSPVKVKVYAFPGYENSVAANTAKILSKENNGFISSLTRDGSISIYDIPMFNDNYGMIKAVVYPSALHKLANINGVSYIALDVNNYLFNDESHSQTQNTHTDTTSVGAPDNLAAGQASGGTTNVWNHGIYGTGVVIGETDTCVGMHHDMFRDPNSNYDLSNYPYNQYNPDQRKVVMYATYPAAHNDHNFSGDSSDHGSHVAGTILGYDNPVGGTSAYDGMAPGAKLSFGDIDWDDPNAGGTNQPPDYLDVPSNFDDMWDPLMSGNLSMCRISSQSWGGHAQDSNGSAVEQSEYMDQNVMIDEYAYNNDKLFTWAAGNEGNKAHTVGIQAESKNTVSVAAADRTDKMASFSSVGPTYDNRLKPDVTMAGTGINSDDAKNGDDKYTSMDGTSMATPGTAGTVGLIQEYFDSGWYPNGTKVAGHEMTPSAALLKADLINGAEEMTDSSATNDAYNGNDGYPSADQGWGFINVDKSLYFSGESRAMRVWDNQFGASTGDNFTINLPVNDISSSNPLIITLAWTDPPAAMGASTALVNDLDLTVTAGGNNYKGNYLRGTNPGHSVTGGDYDHLNNVEEVKLFSGNAGTVQVSVYGYNVPVDPQKFALVMSGPIDMNAGMVYLDNKIYCENGVPQIRLEDADASSPATVHMSSALTGDSEDISCDGGDGLFTGSVHLTLDEPASDGLLSVKDGDTITASYTSGGFTSTFSAKIDAHSPIVSDVHVEYKSNTMAKIGFSADKKVLASVYYGTDPNNLALADWTEHYSTTPEIALKGLSENTLYYYDVTAKDCCGHVVKDDNGGNHYTFTTDSKGDILLVISDKSGFDWQHLADQYADALNGNGWSYNVWYGWDQGTPDLTTLQAYKVVAWQVGIEHYAPFDDTERPLIKDYLDNGGRLWVNSQDVAWALGDTSNSQFASTDTQNWLHQVMKEDWKADNDFASMHGLDSDPISGDYTSDFNYDKYRTGGSGDDVTSANSGGTTSYVWYENDGGDNCGVRWVSSANNGTAGTGVWGGTPSQIVVDNFEWSAMMSRSTTHDDLRSDVLDKTLVWLIGHDHPDVNISNPSAGDTVTADSLNIQWTKTTYGGTGVYQTEIYYSNNSGDAWSLLTTISGDSSSYTWDISSVPNGVNYDIKVVVYDDSNVHMSGYDISGVFTISRAGGDHDAPVILTGSPSLNPVPAHYGDTMWVNATADDSNHGGSNIDQVEFYIDSTSGTATQMGPVDGSFDSDKEDASWSGTCNIGHGDHTLYVRAKDSAGNWGEFETLQFHVNGPEEAVVNMTAGWNFVSIPWLNGPTDINTALDGFSWERALVYQNGQWYSYNTNRDAKFNLGFPQVDATTGMWVYGTGDVQKSGIGASSSTIDLHAGWNLVGYPTGNATRTIADALSGVDYASVEGYDGTSIVTLSGTDMMVPGNAYWILMNSDDTWTVNWE